MSETGIEQRVRIATTIRDEADWRAHFGAQKDSRPSPQSRAKQREEADVRGDVDDDGEMESHGYLTQRHALPNANTITTTMKIETKSPMIIPRFLRESAHSRTDMD